MGCLILHHFLTASDARRAARTLCKLAAHDTQQWALTGGLAVELHHLQLGVQPWLRPLNDIDFVVESFACIPETLADDFIFRHIHPLDPPGKNILQSVDLENTIRVDVFRAVGGTMARSSQVTFPFGSFRLVSLADLVARAARLSLDLHEGAPTPGKYASDFLRLLTLANPAWTEEAWQDHRKPKHPATFAEATRLLQQLIPAHPELLITPVYSRNTEKYCTRCAATSSLRLADPELVLMTLGYC